MNNADRKVPSLDDIEAHETVQWINEQLGRIEGLVREHGSDEEMLEAIAYLRDENDRWDVPEVEELSKSARLFLSNSGDANH